MHSFLQTELSAQGVGCPGSQEADTTRQLVDFRGDWRITGDTGLVGLRGPSLFSQFYFCQYTFVIHNDYIHHGKLVHAYLIHFRSHIPPTAVFLFPSYMQKICLSVSYYLSFILLSNLFIEKQVLKANTTEK